MNAAESAPSPNSLRNKFGIVNATVNADTTGNPSVTISYEPVPTADPSPNGLAFDPQMPGTTSPSKTLTVANNGSAPLNISSQSMRFMASYSATRVSTVVRKPEAA